MVTKRLDLSRCYCQFTGISLQKDDNAFMVFDDTTQIYNDNDTAPEEQKPLHINSTALYKRGWESTHVTAKNDSIIQCVSIFAIGLQDTLLQKVAVTCLSPTPTLTSVQLLSNQLDSETKHSIEMM